MTDRQTERARERRESGERDREREESRGREERDIEREKRAEGEKREIHGNSNFRESKSRSQRVRCARGAICTEDLGSRPISLRSSGTVLQRERKREREGEREKERERERKNVKPCSSCASYCCR